MMLEASLRPGLNPGAEDGEAEGGEVSAERDREGVAASERVHPFLRGAASVARLWGLGQLKLPCIQHLTTDHLYRAVLVCLSRAAACPSIMVGGLPRHRGMSLCLSDPLSAHDPSRLALPSTLSRIFNSALSLIFNSRHLYALRSGRTTSSYALSLARSALFGGGHAFPLAVAAETACQLVGSRLPTPQRRLQPARGRRPATC